MSSPAGKRDVVRLRTFAEDVLRARTEQGIEEPIANEVVPSETEEITSAGVLHKVQKKALDLKEEQAGTDIDAEGVSFDEATAANVIDQSYEAHQAQQEPIANDTLDIKTEAAPAAAAPVAKSALDFLNRKSAGTSSSPQAGTTTAETAVLSSSTPPSASIKHTTDIAAVPRSILGDDHHKVHEVTDQTVSDGAFVTDKKRDRFKLFPAIGTAVSEWVGQTKEKIEEAQKEKHTVEQTEKRIETIKAAAQPKTIAPEEDYDEVAKRLASTPKNPINAAPVVVKPKTETAASWTYTVSESGAAESQSVNPTEVPPALRSIPQTPPQPSRDANMTVVELPTLSQTPPNPPAVTAGVLASEAQRQIAEQETLRQVVTAPTDPRRRTGSAVALPNLSGKREFLPSPSLAVIVVIIAIVSGVGTSIFFFGRAGDEGVLPAPTTEPLFTAELQADIPFGDSHSTIMSTLLSAVSSTPGSLYLYFTRNGGTSVVPPGELMNFLAPQAPGTFTRSVTNVSFGSYNNKPFIVLRVNNFDNAFPGMLAWEQTMSADLAPLFGPVVTESLDAQARTSTQTRAAFFKDIVASNSSSRLLVNERGEDRILYTFLNKQTIVITTDRLTLTNILPLIR